MTKAAFIHLRVHSAYSLAEGAIKIPDLIQYCQQHKMPAVALTDTGNLFGALEFSVKAANAGIQPLIGCQVKVSLPPKDPRRQDTILMPGLRPPCDTLILLAQNEQGYQNLMKLISQSYLQYAHDPHLPFDWLESHHQGLIALSGGLAGGGARLLLQNQPTAAATYFQTLKTIFEDRFYIEITRHGLEAERQIEKSLCALAYDLDIPLVATNEAYFLEEEMHEAHDALLCVASSSYVSVQERRRVTPRHRLCTPEEMAELFADLPEALENTLIIAQRCGYMVEIKPPMLPPFATERGEPEELAYQAREGLKKRLQNQVFQEILSPEEQQSQEKIYSDRLEIEIDIISRMGYAGYYLIVSDFIKWAKKNSIPVGPGRGSGAGSLVAWVLTITDIDPIRFGLLFERFLNPERVSMPDFDIDFCQDRRDEVIAYVQERYGSDRVAQICTFGKMQARVTLRDVGRVLGMPYMQIDRLCKMIPNNPANPVTLKQAYDQDSQLQQMAQEEQAVERLLEISMKLEGLYRHTSTHAAGIVIGDRPLQELVPLYFDGKSQIPATQFNMKDVEKAGLVKFDFLGLKTLTIIQKTIDLIKKRGIEIDISVLPLDDKTTFEMLKRVETVGIFQVEGAGMRDVLKKMQPHRFEELIALVALYRPGPMDDIPRYLACKHGTEAVNYGHPVIESILKETYGVMVYQEQVMQIAQVMGGYTLGGADLLRRAMGKKIKSEMDAQREVFLKGAVRNGIKKALASQIFDQMAKFAGYGFNKCHSGPYALITYQTAYLKANYPVEFMAATMTYDRNNTEKLNMYREELMRMGIPLLRPDINYSGAEFEVEYTDQSQACIRYALAAVKNVGEAGIKELVKDRELYGPFKSMIDFARRLDSKVVNKRMLENLIYAGAFDEVHAHRRQLLEAVDALLKFVGDIPAYRASQQNNLFGSDQEAPPIPPLKFSEVEPWSRLESLQKEVDALGFYLTDHPLDVYQASLEKMNLTLSKSLEEQADSMENFTVSMAGVVISKKERLNKKGARYAFVCFSDSSGTFELVVFSDLYSQFRDQLEAGNLFFLKVSGRKEAENVRLTVVGLEELDVYLNRQLRTLSLHLSSPQGLESLKKILHKTPKGNVALQLVLKPEGRDLILKLPTYYNICPETRDYLAALPGVEGVRDV